MTNIAKPEPVSEEQNRTVRGLRYLWVVIVIVGFFPGGLYFSRIELTVLGWPFFALWTVVIVPFSLVLLYMSYSFVVTQKINEREKGDLTGPDPIEVSQ